MKWYQEYFNEAHKTMDGITEITTEEVAEMIKNNNSIRIFDVREYKESTECLPGAVLLPLGELKGEIANQRISKDDDLIIFYCRSGKRSLMACQAMKELEAQGFHVVSMRGGIEKWKEQKQSVEVVPYLTSIFGF